MARRLLESLSGTGAIHAGEVLLRMTQYELSLWSDDQPDASGDDSKRIVSIDGHIDITGMPEATVLAGAETLTLTIEDGRRLAFQLTSSGGGIVAGGWLPD
jgi:hypothetical protein